MVRSSEFIRNPDGSVYHLNLKPGELARKIILVGDPGRVEQVSQHFDDIEVRRDKREFRTHTGTYRGERLSVLSSGIGTDNIDVVINEADALFNLDWETGEPKSKPVRLQFLRLGTCGGIQADIPVGTVVHSRFAFGGDSLLRFYTRQRAPLTEHFEAEVQRFLERAPAFPVNVYGASSSLSLHKLLLAEFPEIRPGITYTANGFYGPQGRGIGRLQPVMPDLAERIAYFSFRDLRVLNIEMESAAIMGLCETLGHGSGALCVILANRRTKVFAEDPHALVDGMIRDGLEVIRMWESEGNGG